MVSKHSLLLNFFFKIKEVIIAFNYLLSLSTTAPFPMPYFIARVIKAINPCINARLGQIALTAAASNVAANSVRSFCPLADPETEIYFGIQHSCKGLHHSMADIVLTPLSFSIAIVEVVD